jgi:PAS domain S-box-containing protein
MFDLFGSARRSDDYESEHGARLFASVAQATSLVAFLFALADFLAGSDPRGSVINAMILLAALAALCVLRVGHATVAFVTFGWGAWCAITVQALLMGRLDNAVLYAYPVVIMLSGWLLGVRHGFAMCVVSAGAIFGLAGLESHGVRLVQIERGTWGRARDLVGILFVSIFIVSRMVLYQQRQTRRVAALNAQLTETVASLTARDHQLRQAESRFATVGDIIPAPLSLTDALTGEITYVNKAWESVLGWTLESVAGKSPLELGIWFDAASREAFGAEFRHNGCVRHLQMQVQARDGRLVPVSVSADSVEQDGRRMTMSLLYDLTERALMEAKVLKLNTELEARVVQRTLELKSVNDDLSSALSTLKLAQRELVQSEKMAALGALVAGVSHELNTPIGNALVVSSSMHDRVLEFQDLVNRNELKRSTLERFMADSLEGSDLVQRSLQRASELVHSFKQVAVDQSSERQRVFGVQDVVREIIATLRPNLKKFPWRLEVDIAADITMNSFPGALGQVVINLIMNAALHAFEGRSEGRISVTGRQTDDDTIQLVFADDGVGMTADIASRIFDPFFTTRLGQGGSGLGLAIVHQMVTQVLLGRVLVESVPGQGSRFTLDLMRSIAAPSTDAPPP